MDANVERFDLVVVGAGPAGLSAAIEARRAGLSVVVLDEQQRLGGQIYRSIQDAPAHRRKVLGADYSAGAALAESFAACGAVHRTGAAVWNVDRDRTVSYLREGRGQTVRGQAVVLASGAMERPFPVPGWTLPGVMGAGAAQILYKASGAIPSEPVVIAGCGPLLLLLAQQYLDAGLKIKALVQTTGTADYLRAAPHLFRAMRGWNDLAKGAKMLRAIRAHGVETYTGASEFSIEGADRAEAIAFRHKGSRKRIASSLILLHQGVVPNTQLSWSLRAEHRWDEAQLCWIPRTDPYGQIDDTCIYIAGDSRGIVGAKASATQGRLAALDIARRLRRAEPEAMQRRKAELQGELRKHVRIRPFLDQLYRPLDDHRIPPDGNVIVCRCEEVNAGKIRKYVEVGCLGPNQTKAFGRCGMGPCQGRLCGLTVTEVIADERKVSPQDVGYYRIRPPIKPITLGELANLEE
ncbi:FAD/NAD(P)-binding oxidoreductase [Bordetella genomosp. 8]|uniref:FAD/NAD(P)-binding oxidoreductase n=1 Tax=Bordetella genomosp. 8 TaxID=1416806 RepID=A0A1W6YHH2_9BORD|nr:NAD(P)/FAD-dependent oxidoreductase [Bordetella genomosp. 8]ARP79973.1 FAD/NAD(P)-binding oxidoreductase [Bordetella genomosp. 8]